MSGERQSNGSTGIHSQYVLPEGDTGQGCYSGCFVSSKTTFCEVNYSGSKPNVAILALEEPSCGLWSGCFCAQVKSTTTRNQNGKGGNPGRSHLHMDGGGWFKTHKQRTTFLVVVQDEVVKGQTKTTKSTKPYKKLPAPPSSSSSSSSSPSSSSALPSTIVTQKRSSVASSLVPRTIRESVSRMTSQSKPNHSTTL
jgi:hypothetical protein